MNEDIFIEEQIKVILVGVDTGEETDFDHSMEELKSLSEACYKKVVGIVIQKLQSVNNTFYVGPGKLSEIKELAEFTQAEEIVFDNTLSPSQIRNLGRELELPILDRTNLILDIFALRAQTREAKLQVETAKLQYMLPRLVGLHEALSRQGGTSGSMSNKGTGEKKLELDRRRIEHRITELKKELADIAGNRQTQRKRRNESKIPQVALVGYTNAGKSTIMNQMVSLYGSKPEKKVLEKDMLFATLETSVRTIETQNNMPYFLVDTVGFIHKLPHGLVKAFQSTLEEVKYADLLVQVVDYSDENFKQQMEVTRQTLDELGASGIPQIVVYNKADLTNTDQLPKIRGDQIYMAAGKGIGIEQLKKLIEAKVYADNTKCQLLIPYDKGNVASYFMENATVYERKYLQEGILLFVNCRSQDAAKYGIYIVDDNKVAAMQ